MRIIAGKLKGRELKIPKGARTRPVMGYVLEQAMNLFTPARLERGAFLDICAGSGIVGFEALSRGAQSVLFVEADARMSRQLSSAAYDWGVSADVAVLRTDARRCFKVIERKLGQGAQASAVFIDPPFIPGMAADILQNLGQSARLLSPDALVILRTPDSIDAAPAGLGFIEKRDAGSARLWLFRPTP